MAALTALFVLVGLVLVVVGPDADNRLTGLACLLFFGLGGVGYLSDELPWRREGIRCGEVRTSAGPEAAFLFPSGTSRQWRTILGVGGLAAGSALMIPLGRVTLGAVCAGFFGLGFLVLLALGRKPRLVLTPARILAKVGRARVELPWEALGAVEYEEMLTGDSTTAMFGITARDGGAAVWTHGRAYRRMVRKAGYDLMALAEGTGASPDVLAAAILRYRDEPERRHRIGSEEEHARLLRELGEPAVRTQAQPWP